MLILPLIDLLILGGSACLGIGFVMKVLDIATALRPQILGLSAVDFLLLTGLCWGFALTLAARTWVKINEPLLHQRRRESMHARAVAQAAQVDLAHGHNGNHDGVEGEASAARALGGEGR